MLWGNSHSDSSGTGFQQMILVDNALPLTPLQFAFMASDQLSREFRGRSIEIVIE